MTIKAIETVYKGYRFRSRLEARWAVFFDRCGISWEYEVQGLDCDGTWYLPDFQTTDYYGMDFLVEIKPFKLGQLSKSNAAARAGLNIIVLVGNPWPWEYQVFWASRGMPFLVPFPTGQFMWCDQCQKVSLCPSFHDGSQGYFSFPLLAGCSCTADPGDNVFYWLPPGYSPTGKSRLEAAYLAARSARFEHGERPK